MGSVWRVRWKRLSKFLYDPLAIRLRVHQHSHPFSVAGVHSIDLCNHGALYQHYQKTRRADHFALQLKSAVSPLRPSDYSQLRSRFHVLRWGWFYHHSLWLLGLGNSDKTLNWPADKLRYRCHTNRSQFPFRASIVFKSCTLIFGLRERSTDSSGAFLTALWLKSTKTCPESRH